VYYNIKIKSNGSEFSLTSNNKEITQREMDMYFACIFDVSQEFKSQIKKVEIKNTNLKSIKEIENFANIQTQNTAQQSIQKNHVENSVQSVSVQPQQEKAQYIQPQPVQTQQIHPEPIQTQEKNQTDSIYTRNITPLISQNNQPVQQTNNSHVFAEQANNINAQNLQNNFNSQQQNNIQKTQVQNETQTASKAEIDEFLNRFAQTSPNLTNNIPKETVQIMPTFEAQTAQDEPVEQMREVYIPQKEMLEIEFENVSNVRYAPKENRPKYDNISIKDFDLKLEEVSIENQPMQIQNKFENLEINDALMTATHETTQYQENTQFTIQQEPLKELNIEAQIQEQKIQDNFIANEPINEVPKSNEIDELISLAQNKLDSFDISSTEIKTNNNQNTQNQTDTMYDTVHFDLPESKFGGYTKREPSYTQETQQQINLNGQTKINDIFSSQNTEMQTEEKYPQQSTAEYELPTRAEREKILYTPPLEKPVLNSPIMDIPKMDTIIQQANNPIAENQIQNNTVQEQTQQPMQPSYQQDFKLFLNEFNCENTAEIFLICAFYIKNILKEENFTMKFINSKLFQATGRIADLGVLDDLISKEYIRVIESFDAKKYSITPDGEGYFLRRFQG